MKSISTLIVLLLSLTFSFAQTLHKNIEAEILGETRELKIQVPRGHDAYENDGKKYPLIVVLDGDYMFEVVAGNVDYYSFWDDMPNSIVVGINQSENRDTDLMYDEVNSLPIEGGNKFMNFVMEEVLPYMEENFNLEKFKMVVGHGKSANFANYFMLKKESQPTFQSFVVIAPDFAPEMPKWVSEVIPKTETKLFYYLATSTNDIPKFKEQTEALATTLEAVDNSNVFFNSDTFDGPSHYSLPAHSIAKALESTFLVYQPISKKEYKEVITKLSGSPVDYLVEKYETIEDLFGIDKQILINDFRAIYSAIRKSEKWEPLEELAKIAKKEYPDTNLSSYFKARFYEETFEPKKALKMYQSAYVMEESPFMNKDQVLEKIDEIKAEFGL
jgi:predicted alpha/beta superfamily hydrolase